MSLNIESLKLKIKKAIDKMPENINVYRTGKNEFKEDVGEVFVTDLVGQYYDKVKGSFINLSLEENGAVKDKRKEKFMTIVDENSLKVSEGDFFILHGHKYKITDLGNTMNAYFDFSIERF